VKRLALLAIPLVLAACGGSPATKADTPGTTAAPKACPPAGGGTGPAGSAVKPGQTMLLTAVKVDSDACSDRVVFDFRRAGGAEPGYTVSYRPAAEAQTEDASGRHIPIAGKAFLVVRFEPAATADLSGAKLEKTYTGPRTIKPVGMRWVQQISKTGDFEAVLTWAIGLTERRAFKLTSSASRLEIELR